MTGSTSADLDAFRTALAAWEAREEFIGSVKNDFVLSMWFVRYNDTFRAFNPMESMRAYR